MSKVDEYLNRMKRRVQFLEQRVGDKDEEKSHYDRAELMSLQWVIKYIEDTREAAEEHQIKWFKGGRNGETN